MNPARTLIVLLALAAVAPAATILQVAGPSTNLATVGGPHGTNYEQVLAIEWTSASGYSDVDIQVWVGNSNPGTEQLFAYLTNSVGVGTAPSAVVTSSAIDLPANFDGPLSLFEPLSLGPGAYYLVLFGSADTDRVYWQFADFDAAVTKAPGVGFPSHYLVSNAAYPPTNNIFPPASRFEADTYARSEFPLFSITGTAVPEPSMGVAASLLGVFILKRRRLQGL